MGAEFLPRTGVLQAQLGAALLALATSATTVTALASPSEAELRAARDRFAEAEKDEDAGRWSDALEKVQRVAEVKLTSGVRYHLALCEEHLGHLVAALEAFGDAKTQAKADGARDVLRLVGKQLDELGPRVPRLTVRITPADAAAIVTLDGNLLPASSVGAPFPVDPGVHRLEARAAQKTTAAAMVTLHERDVTSIDLVLGEPAATPLPPPPPLAAPAPAPRAALTIAPVAATDAAGPSERSRTGALIATAGAVALAGWGLTAFVLAGNAVTSGEEECAQQHPPCDAQKTAVRAWDFTAAGSWVGAAAVGTLAVVLWTRPRSAAPNAALTIGPASIGVRGQF